MAKEISYSEAIVEIEAILSKINASDLDVDKLSEMVVRANELLELCKAKLTKAQKEVSKINKPKEA